MMQSELFLSVGGYTKNPDSDFFFIKTAGSGGGGVCLG